MLPKPDSGRLKLDLKGLCCYVCPCATVLSLPKPFCLVLGCLRRSSTVDLFGFRFKFLPIILSF